MNSNRKGFTLVEVIVVLLVIGILLAITIPSLIKYVNDAKSITFETAARTVNLKATEYIEKTIINNSSKDFSAVVSDLNKKLSWGTRNQISSIIGVEPVDGYAIFSVDCSFDGVYSMKGWDYDKNKTSHSISKISVWFAKPDGSLMPKDSKFVVTLINDRLYYYPSMKQVNPTLYPHYLNEAPIIGL